MIVTNDVLQGDWKFLQSSNPMTDNNLYETKPYMDKLIKNISNMQVSTAMIPRSKVDGASDLQYFLKVTDLKRHTTG
ncbi:hypothetical protein [Companilactobacillus hulinensis]|uniref:hypothetical protein n=1 Tax=Companilactobacillus hulinensis TaxID=2486007 RepID=UPI000F79327C|nr:hypothetical protein [Companilactobacillus hulinensis]